MNKSRIVIKLGGAALMNPRALVATTDLIREYRAKAFDVVLVHGGGPVINQELQRQGIEWTFVGGQRVTSPAMMKSIEATLCGVVNRSLVRHFVAEGLNAVGFSGADHGTLMCVQASKDLGMVGRIEHVNAAWIVDLLGMSSHPLPVIAPLGVGVYGESYNINADQSAAHLAAALQAVELLFLTDQPGILDEEGQIIESVDVEGLRCMMDANTVSGGMLAKVKAVVHALQNGVGRVRVAGIGVPGTSCMKTSLKEVQYASL